MAASSVQEVFAQSPNKEKSWQSYEQPQSPPHNENFKSQKESVLVKLFKKVFRRETNTESES